MAETLGNIQYPMPRRQGSKIAYAIFRKRRCDFAKRDMRFFGMAGAIFMGVRGYGVSGEWLAVYRAYSIYRYYSIYREGSSIY